MKGECSENELHRISEAKNIAKNIFGAEKDLQTKSVEMFGARVYGKGDPVLVTTTDRCGNEQEDAMTFVKYAGPNKVEVKSNDAMAAVKTYDDKDVKMIWSKFFDIATRVGYSN